MKITLELFRLVFAATVLIEALQTPVQAQVIEATQDANTVVTQAGNTFNITGGTLSDTNLFHSFQQFGLDTHQTASFQSNPTIQNILGRVVGGNPSLINGLIQVMGGHSNLYLMNPSGIIFGSNSSLNVPAAFTATTANGIGFGSHWFNAVGANHYAALVGTPDQLGFSMSQPGGIFNAGQLSVGVGQRLTLVGGTIVNTGKLSALGGEVVVAAVLGDRVVRLSQPGDVLGLEVRPLAAAVSAPETFTMPIFSLPELLTGGRASHANGIAVNPDGTVSLTGSQTRVDPQPGTTIVSGKIDVSTTAPEKGGTVGILGDRVALLEANINASGINGGGTVLIGGDYQGKGRVPNADRTFISQDSTIYADALNQGNGGRVIAWADDSTRFYGKISARGGVNDGNGGFVEVSGKENLAFDGLVDVGATIGQGGSLLLDPATVTISSFIPIPPGDDAQLDDRQINESDGGSGFGNFFITPGKVVSALNGGDVSITAAQSIAVQSTIDSTGNATSHNLTMTAPRIDVNSTIQLKQGSNITLNSIDSSTTLADQINVFEIDSNGGNIIINAPAIELGSLISGGGNINLNGAVVVRSSFLDAAVNSAGTGTGNITFTNTINSETAVTRSNLNVTAEGNVDIQGAIGNTNPLGVLSIGTPFVNGGNNVSFKDFSGDGVNVNVTGSVTVDAIGSLTAPMFIRSFGGEDIQLSAGGNISLPDGLLLVLNNIGTGEVRLNAGGNLTLDSIFLESLGDVSLRGQSITVRNTSNLQAQRDLILQAQANLGTLRVDNSTLEAGRDIQLEALQGNLILQNAVASQGSFFDGRDILLNARSLTIQGNSNLNADRDLNAQIQTNLTVDNSQLQAFRDLTLRTPTNLTLRGNQISAGQNLQLLAQGVAGRVRVEDATGQSIVRATNNLTIRGNQSIEIEALDRPQSVFETGALTLAPAQGNLTLISNGSITGNGRFISKGNFSVLTTASAPGNFLYTPVNASGIISSPGDVSFGNYNGTSLKVEAGGNINAGDVQITGANTTLTGTDSDVAILSNAPALILRAGLTELRQMPNVLPDATELRNAPSVPGSPIGGATFTTSGAASPSGKIRVGTITIANSVGADTVILSAPGDITTGAISTDGGAVKLSSTTGNITVDTINTRRDAEGGGSVDVSANGLFRATGAFDFSFQEGGGAPFITVPTTILTSTGGVGLDGRTLPGEIRIRQGGASFVENYAPGALAETAGGTAGRILRADGNNASLVPSFQDRIFVTSSGTFNPGGGGNVDGNSGGGNVGAGSDVQAAQRQLPTRNNADACTPVNTVAVVPRSSDGTPDRTTRAVSPLPNTTSRPCTPAETEEQILKILETPESNRIQGWNSDRKISEMSNAIDQLVPKN